MLHILTILVKESPKTRSQYKSGRELATKPSPYLKTLNSKTYVSDYLIVIMTMLFKKNRSLLNEASENGNINYL